MQEGVLCEPVDESIRVTNAPLLLCLIITKWGGGLQLSLGGLGACSPRKLKF